MAKVNHFDEVNRKGNLEDVLIAGDKAHFFWKNYPDRNNKKEWKYSEEWAIFCTVIQQSIDETPLILSGNLLDSDVIKDLDIAKNQQALSIIFLDDVTENQKSAIYANLARKTQIKEIKVFDKNCILQDVGRDYLVRLRKNEEMLKIEETLSREENAEEPIIIKTAKQAEIKYADNGIKKGLFLMEENDKGINYHWLSDKFDVIGQGVEIEEGNLHYSMIRFKSNGNGEEITEAILQGEIASAETFKNLRNKGLEINYVTKNHSFLANYISSKTITSPKWRIVSSSGWKNGAYIYPNGEIIGEMDNKQPLFLRNQPINADLFKKSCTLEEWQENVAKYAKGNDFVILSLLFALAAPVVGVVENAPHFGIHIYGDSGSGKSTCSYIANSVYGHGKELERSWSATRTGLVNEAISRNDCLLVMDELTNISQDVGAGIFYELFQGVEKLRGQAEKDQNRRVRTWRTMILSNGERNYEDQLREIFREKNFKAKAGELVRMLNISFTGLNNYHHFANDPDNTTEYHKSLAFADFIKVNSSKYYGVAGREWIAFIRENIHFLNMEKDKNERSFIDKMIAIKPPSVDDKELNQIGRVAKNFALLVTVGKCSKHITGFTDEEIECTIFRCFKLWADEFGWGNKEKMQIIENLDRFIQQNIGDLYHVKNKKIISTPVSKKFVGFYFEEDTRENSYLMLDKRNLILEMGAFPEKKIIESLLKEKRLIRTERKDKETWRNESTYPTLDITTPTKRGLKITLPIEE
ncbi:hypothetical protein BKG91_11700 [Rodentibacter caecimuris]|uniref:DUF927 domain-containing protein n=1 Tax=Rodentibacter caecimuris TaxID=1796644 RepID=A0AAJ3K3Z7_9PAST|nr:DUF927 domain-containing protein [Rodentibacter heylii]AOF53590.1 DNA primase, phage-associated [Pasteurellaceae bacterium NI1060]OOF71094.1 hypothetical protein BKG91_11700 [Rodentibacter heylii]OOF72039.1 hypothetical protein BKG90_05935 [Rodentibacter heylii]OOF74309.1 hypothetical protein BKG99_10460 [Rodentibacter heylii]